jgi:hypothetical protein
MRSTDMITIGGYASFLAVNLRAGFWYAHVTNKGSILTILLHQDGWLRQHSPKDQRKAWYLPYISIMNQQRADRVRRAG